MIKTKLYLQIYLSFIAALIIFAIISGVIWKTFASSDKQQFFTGLHTLISQTLPTDKSTSQTQATMNKIAQSFNTQLSLYNKDGVHIYSTQQQIPILKEGQHGWKSGVMRIALDGGRQLMVQRKTPPWGGFPFIILLLGILALAAYPLSKRLTSRLESLQNQVAAFGEGDLSVRAKVQGNDEIALLAAQFNQTATRIEQLIDMQKHILAGASHELRSPLTRMRMMVELLDDENMEVSKQKLTQNIQALDDLVDELLLASKLDSGQTAVDKEEVDFLALIAEEAANYDAEVMGLPTTLYGNEAMLRRMLRNLLDNAARYQQSQPIQFQLSQQGTHIELKVCDDGKGIATQDIPHIFEPFYQGTSTEHKGSIGLGLSLVQKIVLQHYGAISYQQNQPHGSCFIITLPLAAHIQIVA